MPPQRWFAIAAVAATFVTGMPAFAQQVVITTYGPFSVASTSGTQLSNALYTTNVTTAGTLQVRYNASAGHCSDVRAHILVDGVERGLTAFLVAGQSSALVDVGPVTPGAHVVALQGEGRVSGCNSGVLAGWAGTMDVATSVGQAVAVQAVPGPGLIATLLAFAAGVLLFGPWRRRR